MFHSDLLLRRRISFSPPQPPQPPPSLSPATSREALLRPKTTDFEAQRADLHAGGHPAGNRHPTRRHARVFSGSLAVHAPEHECACGRMAPSPVTRLHSQGRPAPSWCSSPPVVHSEHFFSTFFPFCRRHQLQLPFLPPPSLQFFFSRFSSSSVGFSSSSVVFFTVWVPFFFTFKLHSRDSPSY